MIGSLLRWLDTSATSLQRRFLPVGQLGRGLGSGLFYWRPTMTFGEPTFYVPHAEARTLGRAMWLIGFASGLFVGATVTFVALNLYLRS